MSFRHALFFYTQLCKEKYYKTLYLEILKMQTSSSFLYTALLAALYATFQMAIFGFKLLKGFLQYKHWSLPVMICHYVISLGVRLPLPAANLLSAPLCFLQRLHGWPIIVSGWPYGLWKKANCSIHQWGSQW